MAMSLQCVHCGFVYAVEGCGTHIPFGLTCPGCDEPTRIVKVGIDVHSAHVTRKAVVITRKAVTAATSPTHYFERGSVARESVPRNADWLDVMLGLWIAQSQVTGDDEAELSVAA